MRLPYLQVNQELFEVLAPALSIELEISEGDAALMLLRLWKCLVETGTDEAPPTGLIQGARAAAFIERSVRWSGKPGAFVAACIERLDLIEMVGEGLRIRGAERYRRTWEKNRRRKPAPFAPVTGDKPARQTQTQTQTQTHIASPSEKQFPGAAIRPQVGQPTEKSDDLRQSLEATFLRVRGQTYAWQPDDDLATRKLPTLDVEECSRRFAIGLQRARYPLCTGVGDLARWWNAYAAQEPSQGPSRSKGRASESDKDWSVKQPTVMTEHGEELLLGGGE